MSNIDLEQFLSKRPIDLSMPAQVGRTTLDLARVTATVIQNVCFLVDREVEADRLFDPTEILRVVEKSLESLPRLIDKDVVQICADYRLSHWMGVRNASASAFCFKHVVRSIDEAEGLDEASKRERMEALVRDLPMFCAKVDRRQRVMQPGYVADLRDGGSLRIITELGDADLDPVRYVLIEYPDDRPHVAVTLYAL